MHTNHKGAVAEAKIRAELISSGFQTLSPDFPMPFDLVVYKANKFYKVQVKYCSLKNGCLTLNLRSNHYTDRKGTKVVQKHYTDKDFDVFAVYAPDLDACFYFDNKILGTNSSTVVLRIGDSGNNQRKNIRWAKDYKEFPV